MWCDHKLCVLNQLSPNRALYILEGKFCSLKLFFVLKKKTNFHMSHVLSKLPYMCSRTVPGELKKSTLTKRFHFDFVGALNCLNNASAELAISFCSQSPCWFCWMRTEVADNWFAVVDRFAACSLRMIFVGQAAAGCRCILLFSARGFAMSWRNVNILVLLRRWSMFSSHTAYNFVALYVLPGMHFIAP